MSNTNLKPCPFCGGDAEFIRVQIKEFGRWSDTVVVRCKVCRAKTNEILYNEQKHGIDGEYDEAERKWNRRAT